MILKALMMMLTLGSVFIGCPFIISIMCCLTLITLLINNKPKIEDC